MNGAEANEERASAFAGAADELRPVARAVLDTRLAIVEANEEMGAMTGVPPEALIGQPTREVFATVWSVFEPACLGVLESAEGSPPLRLAWKAGPTGPTCEWLARLRPIREGDGFAGLALVALDQSEQRLLRDELLEAQKLGSLGRLAGGIAHDFNNLLTAIGGYTGLVHAELPAGDGRREDLDEVLKAVERARVLTLRLLAFTRGTPGLPRVTRVDEVVQDTSRLLRHLVGDDIEMRTMLRARGAIRLQPGDLEQVLVNLVVNARDAMAGGGSLIIETSDTVLAEPVAAGILRAPAGEYVRITVADTGAGMTAAVRERIFEPFFTTKPTGEGTGLGLATVFAAVQQAGGELTVSSTPSRGTSFEVYLPRADGPEIETAVERPVPGGTESILLVEDQPQVLAAVARMLKGQGYAVAGVSSPLEALERCARPETRPDLLLTDVVMPVMAGPELARRCLAVAPGLKVLYMSGFSAGVSLSPLLLKPFDQQELGLKVREAIDA